MITVAYSSMILLINIFVEALNAGYNYFEQQDHQSSFSIVHTYMEKYHVHFLYNLLCFELLKLLHQEDLNLSHCALLRDLNMSSMG